MESEEHRHILDSQLVEKFAVAFESPEQEAVRIPSAGGGGIGTKSVVMRTTKAGVERKTKFEQSVSQSGAHQVGFFPNATPTSGRWYSHCH